MTILIIDEEKLLYDFHNIFYEEENKRVSDIEKRSRRFIRFIMKVCESNECRDLKVNYLYGKKYRDRDRYYEDIDDFLENTHLNEKYRKYHIEYFKFVFNIRCYFMERYDATMLNLECSSEIAIKYMVDILYKQEEFIIITGNEKLHLLDDSNRIKVFIGEKKNCCNIPYFKEYLDLRDITNESLYGFYGCIVTELYIKYYIQKNRDFLKFKGEK